MIAKELGKLLVKLNYSDLPDEIIETAKRRLLDFLGVCIAGYRIGSYKNIMNSLKPKKGNCTVLGDGKKVEMREAAVINGFMAHSSYYEDGSRLTGGHPSSAILPAVIALGEERGYGGREMIAGMVVGYEIFNRIGGIMYPDAVRRGFQPTPILAPLAAASACAKMMNLDAEKVSQALNIAAPLGAGLKSALKEAETQPIQVGRGSEAGLTASLLAEEGLRGFDQNLESFIVSHGGHNGKRIRLDGWGAYEIENTYVKLHAGCRGNHAPLDAVLNIVKENNISVNEIKSIKVTIDTVTAANEIHNPRNKNEAQFNIPFSIAVALKNGNASLFQFTDENLRDKEITGMMDKISILADPELDKLLPDKRGAKGEIELKDGRIFNSFMDMAQGEPERPLSYEAIAEKFRVLSNDVLQKKAEEVIDCVKNLESLSEIRTLTDLLIKH